MARKSAEPKVKVGDRFGKLTVVERHDIDVIPREKNGVKAKPNGKKRIGWYCECDCGGHVVISESRLLKEISTVRSCGVCEQEVNTNYIPDKMTMEELQDWNELYAYVKKNIFGYDNSQALPNSVVTRLKGLLFGKYSINNKTVNNANYSYKTVLNTFKYCSSDIQRALRANKFKDEQHKFNYVAKIIENNINDVYMRMKKAEKAKKAEEAIDTSYYVTYVNSFKEKEIEINNELDELW